MLSSTLAARRTASSAGSSFEAFANYSVENCENLDWTSAPGTAAAALLCPAAVPDILRMKRGEWTTSERS